VAALLSVESLGTFEFSVISKYGFLQRRSLSLMLADLHFSL
jgi:hypothetical protein